MTYKQAYDKIIEAYFKDEIEIMNPKFCFCGTISPDSRWQESPQRMVYPYTSDQYFKMEDALFEGVYRAIGYVNLNPNTMQGEKYEKGLFAGMSAALDVLKSIHISRGEVIDETPVFTKRQLV